MAVEGPCVVGLYYQFYRYQFESFGPDICCYTVCGINGGAVRREEKPDPPESETINSQPSTLNPQPSTLNPQPLNLNTIALNP